MTRRVVHVVVPDGIDDPARPSGGNIYDRRVCAGWPRSAGRCVEHPVPAPGRRRTPRRAGAWPACSPRSPTARVVLIDGLVAVGGRRRCWCRQARRLRLVVLVHMPLGDAAPGRAGAPGEGAALSARRPRSSRPASGPGAGCSSATRSARPQVHVAEPGVDAAELGDRDRDRRRAALRRGGDARPRVTTCCSRRWPTVARPAVALRLRRRARPRPGASSSGCAGRRRRPGSPTGSASPGRSPAPTSTRAYAAADVLVLASRAETYGMVVTEALARGLPVIATDVGGVPEALGRGARRAPARPAGPARRPGRAGRGAARWLGDADLRRRPAARRPASRRPTLDRLAGLADEPDCDRADRSRPLQ